MNQLVVYSCNEESLSLIDEGTLVRFEERVKNIDDHRQNTGTTSWVVSHAPIPSLNMKKA
jgi:nitric oxide synthase oxygenase domain/subunit